MRPSSPRPAAIPSRRTLRALTVALLVGVAGCASGESRPYAVAFEGATLIDGTGAAPITDAVFVIDQGQFIAAGPRGEVEVPRDAQRVDLTGKTVIPALVNAHIHLSSDRAERAGQLQHMAYYGAGAVVSLGLDEGDTGFAMREELVEGGARSKTAGRGITRPEPGRSEVPFWVDTPEEAREAVQTLAEQDPDIIKIWVDDRGGQYDKLTPELWSAVIEEAHANDVKVTAHIFYLEDAKGLIRAGLDAFAHGIRDQDVDDELVDLWRQNPNVVLVPNLPGPGVAVDLSWISTVPAGRLSEMQAAQQDRPAAQESFGIQARNLDRLNDAGIPIAFGTDGSTPWAVHQEMEDMVRSGMTPAEVIVAATSTSAELMEWDEVGSVAVGKSADFVVLDADPHADITNTRMISDVYLRGERVDRDAIRARVLEGGE